MNRLLIITLLWSCQGAAKEVSEEQQILEVKDTTATQDVNSIPVPDGYTIILQTEGDLDNDGTAETAVAYNTEKVIERSFKNVVRELVIYKKQSGKFNRWKSSQQAIYGSRDGGMMGDPFDSMHIENGILQIRHEGGSSWKWAVTDKYSFQDDELYLIEYFNISGAPCEYFQTTDFNLVTGKVTIEKAWEDCDTDDTKDQVVSESAMVRDLRITLQNRHEKRVHIVTPKEGLEVFVSTGPK